VRVRILVVDDDQELRSLVGFALRRAGYLAVEAGEGETGLEVFRREQPDLVILDVNLPGMSGFDVCRHLRAESSVPILMLTVRASEEDEVRGLDLGADDYLTKPFSPRTLLARVRALLRRRGMEPGEGVLREALLSSGELAVDPEAQSVRAGGRLPARLTELEFRLMQYLLVNAGHALPAERLAQHVWGYRGVGDRQRLKQLVHRLRQKLEANPSEPRYLLTVANVGYRLDAGAGDKQGPDLQSGEAG
jgi:DNA-binding response OmpR family regulator